MDYGSRLGTINKQITGASADYNKVNNQANNAYNNFNTNLNNAKNYGDIYSQARNQYLNTDEINAARSASTNARNAVDQVNTTINKLPESISQQYGGTGLTEAQRQRAMQTQHSNLANTYNMLNTNYQNASADYNDLANRAMSEVQNVAGGNYQSQQDKLNDLQGAWSTLLGQSNNVYNRIISNRSQLNDVYGQKLDDQQAAATLAYQRWAKNQDLAISKEQAASNTSLQKYLDGLGLQESGSNIKAPKRIDVSNIQAPQKNVGYINPDSRYDTGGIGGLIKQGWHNVATHGVGALFGQGTLW